MSVDEIGLSGKKQRVEDWLLEGTSRREVAKGGVSEKEKGGLLRDGGSPAWVTLQEAGRWRLLVVTMAVRRWSRGRCVNS
jgi:hypothetical protein